VTVDSAVSKKLLEMIGDLFIYQYLCKQNSD